MVMSIFLTAGIISFIYILFKFVEMRVILKENKPLKLLLRDTILVYLSIIMGNFVIEQVYPVSKQASAPQVFTNNPDF